jgi:short-subunit dehydrogenase
VTRSVIDVNVHGLINGTKAIAPGMAERGHGHIVNVASAAGRIAVADGATYSASKYAAVGFSEATRAELAPLGIDVSMVCPSIVATELATGLPSTRGVRTVTPLEVAEVIASAIRRPRAELWVPQWVQSLSRATGVLPRRVQELMASAFRADTVFSAADPAAREAYETRVRPPVA